MSKLIISFDLWNTLILPNPHFKKIRNASIASFLGVPVDTVGKVYSKLKKEADTDALSGIQKPKEELYQQLMNDLNSDIPYSIILNLVQSIFQKNLPIIPMYVNMALIELQQQLRNQNCEFLLISNNNFITGSTINKYVLPLIEIKFAHTYHSTDFGQAKPSHELLDHIYRKYKSSDRFVHIGDNEVCDDFSEYFSSSEKQYSKILVKNPMDLSMKIMDLDVFKQIT